MECFLEEIFTWVINSLYQRQPADWESSGNLPGKLKLREVKREKALEEENMAGTGKVERTPCEMTILSVLGSMGEVGEESLCRKQQSVGAGFLSSFKVPLDIGGAALQILQAWQAAKKKKSLCSQNIFFFKESGQHTKFLCLCVILKGLTIERGGSSQLYSFRSQHKNMEP